MTATLKNRPSVAPAVTAHADGDRRCVHPGATKALLHAVRPHQWAKNALVAAAPALGGVLFHGTTLARTTIAMGAWTLVASAAYLLNDVRDAPADRLHPTKRNRPIASGALAQTTAFRAAAVLGTVGMAAAAALGSMVLLLLASYALLTAAYSIRLKRLPYVELGVVSAGFVLRAATGPAATGVARSPALLGTIAAVALLATAGKRLGELHELGPSAGRHRAVLGQYRRSVLEVITGASAVAATLGYTWWEIGTHPHLGFGWLTSCVAFVLLIDRFATHALDGAAGDPFAVVHGDRRLQLFAVTWLVATILAVIGH